MTNPIKWLLIGVYLFLNAAPANAEQRTDQTQSPAVGINTGPITYNNQSTPISIAIQTPSTSTKLNSLEKKQEALLVAQNPTILDVKDIQFIHFHDELLLVVNLKNTSKLPASDVKVEILNLHSAGTYKGLKPFVLTQNAMQREQAGFSLAIAPDSESTFPLSSLTDLGKKVINIPSDSCIYGAALKPDDLSNSAGLSPDEKFSGISIAHSIGVLLRVRYKSIFKQEHTLFNWVFIQTSDRRSDFVVINKTRTKLVCLD